MEDFLYKKMAPESLNCPHLFQIDELFVGVIEGKGDGQGGVEV